MAEDVSVLGLDVQTSGLDAATGSIDRLSQQMGLAARSATGVETAFARVSSQLLGLGAAFLSVRAGVSTFRDIAGAAGSFQFAMNAVSAAAQSTADQTRQLSDEARRLGLAFGVGAKGAAEAQEILVKAGVSIEDALGGATRASLLLARATGSDLEAAANVAVGALQIFGIQASEIDRVIVGASGVINETRQSLNDYQLALAQGAAVSAAAGLTFEDFNAAIAATAAAFNSGSDQGTSFKNFIASLAAPTSEAAATIKRLGIEAFDAAGNIKQIDEIAAELQEALAGLSTQQQFDILDTIFGRDATRIAVALLNAGADGIRRVRDELIPLSDAQAQADARTQGLQGSIAKLSANFEEFAIRVGEAGLLDALTNITKAATDAVAALSDGIPNEGIAAFETIGDSVAAIIGNLDLLSGAVFDAGAALAAVFGVQTLAHIANLVALERALGATSTAAAALGVASKAAQAGLAAIGGPVTLAIAGVVAAFVAVGAATRESERAFDDLIRSGRNLADENATLSDKLNETRARLAAIAETDPRYRQLAEEAAAFGTAIDANNRKLDEQIQRLDIVVQRNGGLSSAAVEARTGLRPRETERARRAREERDRLSVLRDFPGIAGSRGVRDPADTQSDAFRARLGAVDEELRAAAAGADGLAVLREQRKLLDEFPDRYARAGREAAGLGATVEQIRVATLAAAEADARLLLAKEAQREAASRTLNIENASTEAAERRTSAILEQGAALREQQRLLAGEAQAAALGPVALAEFRAASDLLATLPDHYEELARRALGARAAAAQVTAEARRLATVDARDEEARRSQIAFAERLFEAQRALGELEAENATARQSIAAGLEPQLDAQAEINRLVGETRGLLDEEIEARVSAASAIVRQRQEQERLNRTLRENPASLSNQDLLRFGGQLGTDLARTDPRLQQAERDRQRSEQNRLLDALASRIASGALSGADVEAALGGSIAELRAAIDRAASGLRDAGDYFAQSIASAADGFLDRFLRTGRLDFAGLGGALRDSLGGAFSEGVRGQLAGLFRQGGPLGDLGRDFSEGFRSAIDFGALFDGQKQGFGDSFGSVGGAAGSLAAGAQGGQLGFSLGRAVAGRNVDTRAGRIGGSVGGGIGFAAGTAFGGPIGGLIGSAIGSFIGSTIGSLFAHPSNNGAGLDIARSGTLGAQVLGSRANEETSRLVRDAGQRIAEGQNLLRQLGAQLDSTVSQIVIGTRDTSQFRISGTRRNEALRSNEVGDANELSSTALREVLRDARFDSAALDDLRGALLGTSAGFEEILRVLGAVNNLLPGANRGLTELEVAVRDINRAFDEEVRNSGDAGVQASLNRAREASLAALRDDFGKSIETALLEAANPAAARLGELIEASTNRIRDAIAVGYDLNRVYELNTAQLRQFIEQGSASVEAFEELTGVFERLLEQARATGADEDVLRDAFAVAQRDVVRAFDEATADAIRRAGNATLADLQDLLEESQARIESARAIGGNVNAAEQLASLRLERFFADLSEEQLRELGDYLGTVTSFAGATTATLVALRRELDVQINGFEQTRQRLQDQANTFRDAGQALLDIRQGNIDRFGARNPLEQLGALQGRFDDLATRALQGDATAARDLGSIAPQLVDQLRQLYGSTEPFFRALDDVNATLENVGGDALNRATLAERALDAAQEQTDLLRDIRDLLNNADTPTSAISEALAGIDRTAFSGVEQLLAQYLTARTAQDAANVFDAEQIRRAALAATSAAPTNIAPPAQAFVSPAALLPQQQGSLVSGNTQGAARAPVSAPTSSAQESGSMAALTAIVEQNETLIALGNAQLQRLDEIRRNQSSLVSAGIAR